VPRCPDQVATLRTHVPEPPRSTSCALVGGERRSALEGLTIRIGACWALADDGAPGHPASVAPPVLRLGHLEAPETWRRRETPATMHRAGLDGRLLSSGSVWWRGDVDDDRRLAWLSASALSAKSGPCGVRTRARIGDICVSGVKPVVRPGTRELPQRPTCRSGSTGTWRSPRHVGGSGDVSVRRRTFWSCGDGGVCAMQGSPSGGLSLAVCQGSTMGPGARGPSRRARRAARR